MTNVGPATLTAAIRFSGMPHNPKPPTNNLEPDLMSATAAAAEGNTFDDINLPFTKFDLFTTERNMIEN